jgi:hypothetical protein
MAAISSFLIGGCLSIGLAVWALLKGGSHENLAVAWVVLAVSFVADGSSLVQSLRQARREAQERGVSLPEYLLRSSDPALRAVVGEDGAVVIGVLLAARARAIAAGDNRLPVVDGPIQQGHEMLAWLRVARLHAHAVIVQVTCTS